MSTNWDTNFDNKSAESIFELQFSVDANDNGNSGMSLFIRIIQAQVDVVDFISLHMSWLTLIRLTLMVCLI